MKKGSMFLSLLLLACLLLPACAERNEPQPPPPAAAAPNPPPAQPAEEPIALEALTLEVVVEAGEADALLPQLEALSSLLGEALLERGYAPEQVTVTIGTAGGITGDALRAGGVDAACLPAADYLAAAEGARAVLVTDEAVCAHVAAVGAGREELDGGFCAALAGALTESGFLERCYPRRTYIPATEEALEALRDWAAEEGLHGL